jgi:colanic acid/amylovoran biosynthesis glycosyltransferase
MSTKLVQRILVLSALDADWTKRTLASFRLRYGKAQITLIISDTILEHFAGALFIDHFFLYHRARTLLGTVTVLLRELRKQRYDLFALICQDTSRTNHLRNLILFSLLIPCRKRILVGPDLVERDIDLRRRLASFLDTATLLVGVPFVKILTLIVVSACSLCQNAFEVPGSEDEGRKKTRIAILLPILPDASHVFIYREILEMRRQGAQFDLVALEEGDHSLMHPEARALLSQAIFVPRISQNRYLLLYLYFLLRHPIRLRRLLSLYVSQNLGDIFLLLDVNEVLHNSLHPSNGIALAWELKKLRTSYMHIYGSTYPATRSIVASFLLEIPFSLGTFVDFDYDYAFKMFREKVELARFVVASTQFCADRIRSYTSEEAFGKVRVIHFGINQDHARKYLGDVVFRDGGPLRIVAVGRLVEKKGFEYLIRALALLKVRGITARCTIIGGGPEETKLRSLLKDMGLENEVELVGPIPNDQLVARYLKPQNILVAPSVYAKDGERDGIPTVLLEAMVSGVPVISTTVSGVPELVVHGENGLLVPERDERGLADAIEELLQNPGLRERLRAKGREVVLEDFDIRNTAHYLWSLIESEANRSRTE